MLARPGDALRLLRSHGVPHQRCGKLLVATARNQLPQLAASAERQREWRPRPYASQRRRGDGDWNRNSSASRRCFRRRRASSTAISSCSRCKATPNAMARTSRSIRPSTSIDASERPLHRRGRRRCAYDDQRRVCDQQRGPARESSRARFAGSMRAMCRRFIFARATISPFAAARRSSRLIYPMPNEAGLGVHLTIDLGGAGEVRAGRRMGPVDQLRRRSARADAFYAAIRAYWPSCPTARCIRPMREFARSSPARASPPPTS